MPLTYKPIIPKHTTPMALKGLRRQFVALMGDFVTEAQDELATYPGRPPTSKYRRTGTLGRSWQHRVEDKGGRIEGVVGSQSQIAPYNLYVQGPRQAKQHKGRWKTPQQVAKKRYGPWVTKVRAAIRAAAR